MRLVPSKILYLDDERQLPDPWIRRIGCLFCSKPRWCVKVKGEFLQKGAGRLARLSKNLVKVTRKVSSRQMFGGLNPPARAQCVRLGARTPS
jgi:hypothetical protein